MSEHHTGPGWQGSDGTWYSPTMPSTVSDSSAGLPPAPSLVAPVQPMAKPQFTISPPRRWSGLATASMVLGVLWLVWIGSLLALVFGYIALQQTSKDADLGGRSMAVVGIILGWVGVGTFVLFVALRWA